MKYCSKVIKLCDDMAKAKNEALKEMLKSDSDYFFLIEDNCKVKDTKVFQKFIDTSKATGIEALMWGKGGINRRIDFNEDPHIDYYTDFAPAFCMYTRNAVEKAGYFDEVMPHNTWQELEYAKRIGDKELSTPFGMFAAPKNIDGMLELTKEKNEFANVKQMDEALNYWEKKQLEDFPIEIKKKRDIPLRPIMEMI
jgi:hypothetical protein